MTDKNNRLTFFVAIALAIVTLAIYSRSAYLPFSLIDDSDYVLNNNRVSSGLSAGSVLWAFTSFHASNWHPVTWLSLMLDSELFGLRPVGYHLVNVALHAGNAVLLFLLLQLMTGARWRSAFVAACFALHPLHVESVAWITERKDVLSTFFFLLTLLAYALYVKRSQKSRYVLCLVLFSLGLMAKPMLVTVPVVLLLLDFWPLGRFRREPGAPDNRDRGVATAPTDVSLKTLLLEKLPFLLLALASSLVTMYAQRDTIRSLVQLPVDKRLCNALGGVVAYARKMLLPVDLAPFYPYAAVPGWQTALALLLILAISVTVFKYYRQFPYLAFGWLWYLVTLIPVLGLVQVGSQSMADRYTYIPLIGLFTMIGWGGGELCQRVPQLTSTVKSAAVIVLLALSVVTWNQLAYWEDNASLASHAIEVTEANYFAHFMLGRAYEKEGKTELALTQYQEALRINPEDASSHLNLGSILNNQGRVLEAIGHFAEALKQAPGMAEAHFSLGAAYGKLGRMDDAINEYRAALQFEPDNAMYHNNLGTALAQQGGLNEAIQHFYRVLQLTPENLNARSNLDLALKQRDRR